MSLAQTRSMRALQILVSIVFVCGFLGFNDAAHATFSGKYNISSAYDVQLLGVASGDESGYSVSPAGDVNCDGYDDVIIGAPYNDDGGSSAGAAFIIFGPTSMSSVNLSTADVELIGEAASDYAGHSVAAAGDVNGDGCDDVLVGAYYNDNSVSNAGTAYLIYGKSTLADMSLASADVRYDGANASDYAGYSVAGAGDVNRDGYDDILIGAYGFDSAGSSSGAAYLIFGSSTLSSIVISGSDVRFFGESGSDYAGKSVAPAGDFNGDGYDDFLIGAPGDDDGGSSAGAAYLILGQSSAYPHIYYLSGASKFMGENASDYAGTAIAPAGDVNGDGKDDFLIGAYAYDNTSTSVGAAYLFYGTNSSRRPRLSDLGLAPVKFEGEFASDYAGYAVSGAGDINGDGYDDFLIGAYGNDRTATSSGTTYLVYGSATIFGRRNSLSTANASFGGIATSDYSGYAVSAAGDLNADGKDDFLIGAYGNDSSGSGAGATYLIYGE